MVQEALEATEAENQSSSLSTSEINTQIHNTIQEAITSHQQSNSGADSKMGFLQKVVTLDCFFGGSDCLFKDKKSMMDGTVTEFAKKKFEQGDKNVAQYLAQIKEQVQQNMQASESEAKKSTADAKTLVNAKQTVSITKNY